ncbi:hypothetical protein VPH35_102476 [Triticum aestivum]
MTRLAHLAGAAALFLLAAAIPATTVAVLPSEADALLEWKASLIDAAALSSWTRATPVCDWHRVYCDNKSVVVGLGLYRLGLSGRLDTLDTVAFPALTHLDLSINDLGGAIPASISQLRSLKSLNLSNNGFNGSIPPQLDCWWSLEALLFMDLSNNYFSSKIPAPVANHNCSLRSLYLAGNGFGGAFPPVLEGCNSLSTLDIGNNMFFGVIPPWIGSQIPLLRILSLRSNNFTGEIPPELSRLSQLQLLDMANNNLTGSIPVSFDNLTSMKHPRDPSTTGLLSDWKLGLSGRLDTLDTVAFPALTHLDLSINDLGGAIPASISQLRSLKSLNLSNNGFNGSIPPQLGDMPNLLSLRLDNNSLVGAIPRQLCSLFSMKYLHMSNNQLSGGLQICLCNLQNLLVIRLRNNRLTGELPDCWWNLQSMDLSNNSFSGEIPAAKVNHNCSLFTLYLARNAFVGDVPLLLGCTWLVALDISSNRFNSSIPPQLNDMRGLNDLRLYNNNLVGNIPHQLCRLISITVLDLSNNRLTGDLPDCWCNFQVLLFMDLSNNRLTGKLPDCWWSLEALLFMDLSNNYFSSKIPAPVANHNCSLRSLYLAGNGFGGAFPPVLEGCNSLSTLDIGNNMFFGVIPPWIGSQIPLLRILSLRSNNFTGEIPPELSRLSQLQLLDMANNSLTGSIPVSFDNLTSMKHPRDPSTTGLLSDWKYNDRIDIIWKGKVQKFRRAIRLLAGIDLSDNLLSQCIPEELTNLQGLRFLNLSRNHMSCRIPQGIGSLSFLEILDLSSNQLFGNIPQSITRLSGLNTLNVSNNLLSGKIPTGNQIQTLTDPSIYSNNSGLCGFPLNISCTNTSLAPDERNGEEEDHWMYYCVIAGIVSGLWLWFGMLFTIKSWRCGFLSFVDGMQCKIMKKL